MTGRGEEEWGGWDPGPAKGRGGLASLILATLARTLAQRVGVALLLAAVGLCLGFRNVPTGLAFAGAFLAFASCFAIAKLRTEMVRAPVHARAALCWSRRLCRGP
jgi:hypothetical protein